MRQIEISPKAIYNELRALQQKELNRQITEALKGRQLTPVQRRQLEIEIESSTTFHEGELIATDADGNTLTDQHGWPKPIQDHIKETAKTLLNLAPEAPPMTTPKPTTPDEYFRMMREAKTAEERLTISRAYTQK